MSDAAWRQCEHGCCQCSATCKCPLTLPSAVLGLQVMASVTWCRPCRSFQDIYEARGWLGLPCNGHGSWMEASVLLLAAPFAWALASRRRGRAWRLWHTAATTNACLAGHRGLPALNHTLAQLPHSRPARKPAGAGRRQGQPAAAAATMHSSHAPPRLAWCALSLQKAAKHYSDAIFLKFFGERLLFCLILARHCCRCCCDRACGAGCERQLGSRGQAPP